MLNVGRRLLVSPTPIGVSRPRLKPMSEAVNPTVYFVASVAFVVHVLPSCP